MPVRILSASGTGLSASGAARAEGRLAGSRLAGTGGLRRRSDGASGVTGCLRPGAAYHTTSQVPPEVPSALIGPGHGANLKSGRSCHLTSWQVCYYRDHTPSPGARPARSRRRSRSRLPVRTALTEAAAEPEGRSGVGPLSGDAQDSEPLAIGTVPLVHYGIVAASPTGITTHTVNLTDSAHFLRQSTAHRSALQRR